MYAVVWRSGEPGKKWTLALMSTILFLFLLAGCNGPGVAPPTIDFCRHTFSSGTPSAWILLDPVEAPIAEVRMHYDKWDVNTNPPDLVKEDPITALNGQVWQRAEPVTPEEWWTSISEGEWTSNPLESLVAVTLEWDFAPPLGEDEKLVYEVEVRYETPDGNTLLTTSDWYTVSAATGTEVNSDSEMCQDFLAFMIGG